MRVNTSYLLPILAALAAILLAGFAEPRLMVDLRNGVFDGWQRVDPRPFDPESPVRIVAVDEASLQAFGQWPWPRTRLAEAVAKLTEMGAAAVVFDIIFSEPDRTSLEAVVETMPPGPAREALSKSVPEAKTNDQAFAEAIAAGPVVLGATLIAEGASPALPAKAGFVVAGDDAKPFIAEFFGAALPLPILTEAAKGIGATNWLPDRDQVIRRVPLLVRSGESLLPALSMEALRVAQDASTFIIRASNASGQSALGGATGVNAIKVGDKQIETGARAEIRPYYSASRPERFISLKALLQGAVQREEIEGRIVLIGTTAIGLGDIRATPLDAAVAGVEIHAQILEAVLGDAVLARPDWAFGAERAGALVLFLLLALLLPRTPPLVSALAFIGVLAVCAFGSFLAFSRAKVLLDPAFPAVAASAAYLAGTLALWRAERINRERVRNAFGKFLAPAVVDRLAADPRGLVLGGETRELTILFSDLRNFSGISEGLDAQELTRFMNEYLTPMTDAVLDHEGTVDKYIGDAIMAFWNAPLEVRDHAAKAVATVLRMRSELAALNETRARAARERNLPFTPVAMGVGLNVGLCTVGNMGSLRRFDYSVLGDAVNLASRLEGVSKMYAVDLVASEIVVKRAPDFAWLELDRIRVKGRTEASLIYTLAGDAAYAQSDAFRAWREAHVDMLAAFRARDLGAAISRAERLREQAAPEWQGLYLALGERFADVARTQQGLEFADVRILETK